MRGSPSSRRQDLPSSSEKPRIHRLAGLLADLLFVLLLGTFSVGVDVCFWLASHQPEVVNHWYRGSLDRVLLVHLGTTVAACLYVFHWASSAQRKLVYSLVLVFCIGVHIAGRDGFLEGANQNWARKASVEELAQALGGSWPVRAEFSALRELARRGSRAEAAIPALKEFIRRESSAPYPSYSAKLAIEALESIGVTAEAGELELERSEDSPEKP